MFNNCKKPVVLIKEEENGPLCMRDALSIRFDTCNSLDTKQQWVILKTGNASDSIHICQQNRDCLTAYSPIYGVRLIKVRLDLYQQSDTSQHWLMNSKTHQLSNVQHHNGCITTRHYFDPALALVFKCNDYHYKSPNPKLSKHQSFYPIPVLDKNGEQLCADSASTRWNNI